MAKKSDQSVGKPSPTTSTTSKAVEAGASSAAPQSNEAPAEEPRFTTLFDEWTVQEGISFESPTETHSDEQIIIFPDSMKNGSITVDIMPRKSLGTHWNKQPVLEAAVVFRYNAPDKYYYAGFGAWETKLFVAKVIPGPVWFRLNSVGQMSTIRVGSTYRLRVDCFGNRIALFENDVRLFEVYDEDYHVGQWGLRTYKTNARFTSISINPSSPQCFVVMPFAAELKFVYDVIKSTVESYGMKCIRADEIAISRPIIDDIRTQISEADLVIVDFTGKNSNVYFEAGLADAWKKKWIVIAQSTEDLSFDVKHVRTIVYSNRMGADIELKEHLHKAIQETMGLLPRPAGLG